MDEKNVLPAKLIGLTPVCSLPSFDADPGASASPEGASGKVPGAVERFLLASGEAGACGDDAPPGLAVLRCPRDVVAGDLLCRVRDGGLGEAARASSSKILPESPVISDNPVMPVIPVTPVSGTESIEKSLPALTTLFPLSCPFFSLPCCVFCRDSTPGLRPSPSAPSEASRGALSELRPMSEAADADIPALPAAELVRLRVRTERAILPGEV